MADLDFAPSWHRLTSEGETPRCYHAFLDYLHLPSWSRSLADAYVHHRTVCQANAVPVKPRQRAPREHTDWRFKYRWPERAAAYDAHLVEEQRRDHLAQIKAMNARHVDLACQAQQVIAERLKHFLSPGAVYALSPLALARVLELASTVERRALGEASEIIKTQEQASDALPDLRGLSDAELDQLSALLQKAKIASGLVSV